MSMEYGNLDLPAFRRHLHSHAELSDKESTTADIIVGELKTLKSCSRIITNLGGFGVAGIFESKQGVLSGACLVLRCELDALPIVEVNTFDHKSRTHGVSHKCGHDGHMATMIGVARALDSRGGPKTGRVVFIFQPAEETGQGAARILADPQWQESVLKDITDRNSVQFIAFHNTPGFPGQQVVLREGSFSASVRSVSIQFTGKTSHAAEPEHGVSPAEAIAALLSLPGTISVPDIAKDDFFVLTTVHASLGESGAYGVSAGEGVVQFTMRAWQESVMSEQVAFLLSTAQRLAQEHGLTVTDDWCEEFSSTKNDPSVVELMFRAATKAKLDIHMRATPFKWGEDFGLFTQKYRGAMCGVGVGTDGPELHNPDYDFNDSVLPSTVALFDNIVVDLCG